MTPILRIFSEGGSTLHADVEIHVHNTSQIEHRYQCNAVVQKYRLLNMKRVLH